MDDLTTIKQVASSVRHIFMSTTLFDTLLSFEKVISELDVYVFKNWKKGELVSGPIISRHFVTCTFMWPYKKKPDERVIDRLELYDCKVKLREGKLRHPVEVQTPEDFKNGTKVARMVRSKIWLAEISIPKTLIEVIQRTSEDLEDDLIKDKLEYTNEAEIEETPEQLNNEM